MNELQIFDNQEFGQVRVIEKDGQPWFVAQDICTILDVKNATQALYRLEEDERSMFNIGRQGEANIVNEYGLYSLILSSRKQEAKQFKRWITHEVIPQIRKTGSYQKPQSVEELIIMQAQSMLDLKTEVNQITGTINTIKESIEDKPKDEWRQWVNESINKIVANSSRNHEEWRSLLYLQLQADAKCDLGKRLQNAKQRMALAGARKTDIKRYCKLSVIEDDAKLKSIFTSIIERVLIKHVA